MKKFSFDTLSIAIGVMCLVASASFTASAEYIQGQPAGCVSDHCDAPRNDQPYCVSTCPITTNEVDGEKICCKTINGAHGDINRFVKITYTDKFCGTDCDLNGEYIYTSCRFTRNSLVDTGRPCIPADNT